MTKIENNYNNGDCKRETAYSECKIKSSNQIFKEVIFVEKCSKCNLSNYVQFSYRFLPLTSTERTLA